jgi:hypothetical protein
VILHGITQDRKFKDWGKLLDIFVSQIILGVKMCLNLSIGPKPSNKAGCINPASYSF